MSINTALAMVSDAANKTDDIRARNTFWDIYGVITRASAEQANNWAQKIPAVIDYVNAGNYAGTYEAAKKILNKRCYR